MPAKSTRSALRCLVLLIIPLLLASSALGEGITVRTTIPSNPTNPSPQSYFIIPPPINWMTLRTNLLGFWLLNETTGDRLDSIGVRNLSVTGTVGTTNGPFGNPCAAFRHSGFLINSTLTPAFTGTQMTIALWVRLREQTNIGTPLALQWASGGWLVLDSTAGVLRAGFGHDGTDHILTPITTNEWHHITSSWDGTRIRVNLDGNFYTLNNTEMPENPPFVSNSGAPFLIGAYGAGDALSLSANADICNVGLWDRALNDSEVNSLYTDTAGLYVDHNQYVTYPSGEYSCVFSYPGATPGTSGAIRLTRNYNNQFTGKFFFGGVTTPFKGSFNFGTATIQLHTRSTGGVTLTLHTTQFGSIVKITGTASGWYFATTPLVLERNQPVYKNQSIPQAGLYNFTLALSGTGDPSVVGTGSIRVDPTGKTQLNFNLVDGTKLTATGQITDNASRPYSNFLYGNTGSFAGTVYFDEVTHSCSGKFYWYKPLTKSKTYPAPLSAALTLSGTRQ